MVDAISSVGSAQIEALTRATAELLDALAVQQTAERKLAAAAIKGTQDIDKQVTAGLVDVMA